VSSSAKPRILVVFNRDFEDARADPDNRSREDIRGTADDVLDVLAREGFAVDELGITNDLLGAAETIDHFAPDAVFNLCESIGGDAAMEPLVPLLLERAGIVYTGSPPLALTLALHKHKAKDVLRGAGVPTPEALTLVTPDVSAITLPFPLIVKPAREDASVGISRHSVVHDREALERQVKLVISRYRQPALVERYIEGREIYVSMLGRSDGPPQLLPFHEIDFSAMPADRPRIVSFDGKWDESSPEYEGTKPVPCLGLSAAVEAEIGRVARMAFASMELRDYGRLDVRLAADGTPYVIDVNPNCDLSAAAGGFARAGRAAGLDYDELIRRIVDLALTRRSHADTIPLASRSRAARRNHLQGGGIPARGGVLRDRAARRRARSG
jgi:D-alanine-D-alanine ligase